MIIHMNSIVYGNWLSGKDFAYIVRFMKYPDWRGRTKVCPSQKRFAGQLFLLNHRDCASGDFRSSLAELHILDEGAVFFDEHDPQSVERIERAERDVLTFDRPFKVVHLVCRVAVVPDRRRDRCVRLKPQELDPVWVVLGICHPDLGGLDVDLVGLLLIGQDARVMVLHDALPVCRSIPRAESPPQCEQRVHDSEVWNFGE